MSTSPRALTFVALVLAFALMQPGDLFAQPNSESYTPVALRRIGQQAFHKEVTKYGKVEDRAWNETMSSVMERLKAVSNHPDLEITWAIVDRDKFNAGALPGGYIIVYRPLYEFIQDIARKEASGDRALRDRRERAYLAAVLSHELSHVLLGHTAEVTRRMRAAVDEATWNRILAPPATYERELSFDPAELTEEAYTRPRELAADSAGALLMLRAGWEVEDAMRYFRHMDEWERDQPTQIMPTALRTHPRASHREASLQAFLADVKLDQARLDDAISLIRLNAELDLAIELSSQVLMHFPNLISARHAHATALHRRWFNSVPIQVQQVRTTLALRDDRFIAGVRGQTGDDQLLRQAREGYLAVLEMERIPETLSNLALIEAHLDHRNEALGLAREAARLAPDNGEILNNLGAVLYLSGKYVEALSAFERARELVSKLQRTAIVFNIGRALLAMDEERGRRVLEEYLSLDERTNWHRYAVSLLEGEADAPTRLESPPSSTDRLAIEPVGLRLGMPAGQAVATIGTPERIVTGAEGAVLHYDTRGLFLIVVDGRVQFIAIQRMGAGSIGGIKPGDELEAADLQFGRPTGRSDNLWFYQVSDRSIVVAEESGRVGGIGIGFRD